MNINNAISRLPILVSSGSRRWLSELANFLRRRVISRSGRRIDIQEEQQEFRF
jgi:hypothetical protein